MIEVYKQITVEVEDTTINSCGICQKTVQEGIQANSFYYRTIKNWNELPRNVVSATTVNSFKKQLDDAWEDKPFKYDPKQLSGS